MAVIRRNFLDGTTSVLLSAGGVTMTSAELAALPVVAAPDYAWVSLDPLEEFGLPEIVKVTAHSSGSVSATIERGMQQTEGAGPAREHPSGTYWAHAHTALDLAAGGGSGGGSFAAADAFVYLSPAGNDSNDGLSPDAAKLTLAGAYAALPSTGGRILAAAGTYSTASTVTITPGKPVGVSGAGRMLTIFRYTGTGTAVQIGTGASFLDWGFFEDCQILCSHATSAVTGVNLNNAHRGYFHRAGIIGGGNFAGSTGLKCTDGYQNYIKDSLIYGQAVAVDLLTACHDFSLIDSSLDATSIALHVNDTHNVRLQGGQISGAAVGVQIDADIAGESGFAIESNTHFEGNTLDVAIGPAATSTQALEGVFIACSLPNGILIDRAKVPVVITSRIAVGKTITLTANCSDATLFYSLDGGTLSDLGVRTNTFKATGSILNLALLYVGSVFATGTFKTTIAGLGYDFNPATATGTILRSLIGVEANERFGMRFDGQQAWGPGGGVGTDIFINRKGAGALEVGGAIAPLTTRQTLAAPGAVTFDFRYGQVYVETLQANATSSAITGGTPADGQILTIEWVQDATGGRTYVWPTNCEFTGGEAPVGTTPSTRRSVTFRYDSTLVKWVETARATDGTASVGDLLVSDWMTSSVFDVPGRIEAGSTVVPAAGTLSVAYFEVPARRTITKLGMSSVGAYSVISTLTKFGLWTAVDNGDLTLVAQTASDTSIFAVDDTYYERALDTGGGFPASYDLVPGQRYAVGYLIVGGTPGSIRAFVGHAPSLALTPRVNGAKAGQTDLGNVAAITSANNVPWLRLSA